MFLHSLESIDVFQQAIPKLPMGKYAHVIMLRETNSFALFQTDGELNISRVSLGRKAENQSLTTRIVLFKRKQSTPERLTGRELLRRYGLVETCKYNTAEFCKRCPDCIYYGFAIGNEGGNDQGPDRGGIYLRAEQHPAHATLWRAEYAHWHG